MRASPRQASLFALALGWLLCGAGCQTVVTPPTDQDPSKEAWVAPWDKVARAHEAQAPKTISRLRTGEHLRLSSLRAGVGAPANLPRGACALIVIEGRGTATSADQEEVLEPGRILVVPDGGQVTIASGEVLRGMLVNSPKPGPAGAWQVMDVATIPIAEEAPGGDTELVRFEGALSMRSLTVFELGGIPRHVHLVHDSVFLFLNGEGTIGLGSEAATETTGPSVRDENLKRSFITTPVGAEVMVFLPAGSVHSFFAKGKSRILALQFFGPAFDGKDGHHIPSRAPAPGG